MPKNLVTLPLFLSQPFKIYNIFIAGIAVVSGGQPGHGE